MRYFKYASIKHMLFQVRKYKTHGEVSMYALLSVRISKCKVIIVIGHLKSISAPLTTRLRLVRVIDTDCVLCMFTGEAYNLTFHPSRTCCNWVSVWIVVFPSFCTTCRVSVSKDETPSKIRVSPVNVVETPI